MLSIGLVSAQNSPQPVFKNYSVDNGMPSSEVYNVIQDDRGYLWFASDRGVSSYNGYEFKNHTLKEGLTDNVVFELYKDYKNRIWVLPMNGKLCYFENDTIKNYKFNKLLLKNLGKNKLAYSFYVDTLDNIHLGTIGNGLITISKNGEVVKENLDSLNTSRIVFKKTSDLLLSSYKIDRGVSKNNFQYSYNNKVLNIEHVSAPIRSKAYFVGTDLLCFNTTYKVVLYNFRTHKVKDQIIFKSRISSFKKIEKKLLIGQEIGGGISIYEVKEQQLHQEHHFLEGHACSDIIKDKNGGYWVTTTDQGVFYAPNFDVLSYTKSNGLLQSYILELEVNNQSLLINDGSTLSYLTDNGKIIAQAEDNTSIKTYLGETAPFYKKGCIIYYNDVMLVDECKSYIYPTIGHGGFNKKIIKDGTIYFFSKYQGFKYAQENLSSLGLEAFFTHIEDVELISEDDFWIGNTNGLFRFSSEGIISMSERDSLFANRVVDIDKTDYYGLIVATRGAGIILYKNNRIANINSNNGLISDDISRVHIDADQNIWLATNKGLHKIDATNPELISYYSASNGLVSNEITDIDHIGNKIYVATKKGLSILNQNNFTENKSLINVEIVGIKLNNLSIPVKSIIDIMPKDRYIEIMFLGLDYEAMGNIEYKYRIIEISDNWRFTENREVKLDAFPDDGEYTIEIMARRSPNGIWGEKPAQIQLKFHPPFYKTWTFRLSILGFIFLLIYLGFRFKVLAYNQHIQQEVFNRVLKRLGKQSYLIIQSDKKEIRINENDILFIQAFKNYVEISTLEKKYLYRSTIASIEKKLSNINFMRVNRSYIVQKDRIDSIAPDHIIVGAEKIIIGITYLDRVKELKNQFSRLNQ